MNVTRTLIISLRNFKKNPSIYLLNIFGLSVGIAAFLFIVSYAHYENAYDQFHENINQLYRVNHIVKQDGKDPYVAAATFPKVGPALVHEFSQIEASFRVMESWHGVVAQVDKQDPIEHERVFFAETGLFELFSFPLLAGDRKSVLDHLHTAAISKEIAIKHFGTTDCIGEHITIRSAVNGSQVYEVTGVFNQPLPTHVEVNILLSFSSLLHAWGQEIDQNWSWFDFVTYVQLSEGTLPESLENQFPAFIDKHGGERMGSDKLSFDLFPVADIHLQSKVNQEITTNGDAASVKFLFIIGVFILLIAWVNYINLYSAQASERAKDVGIRKALGSSHRNLITLYLIESGWINLISMAFGFAGFLIIQNLSETYLGIAINLQQAFMLKLLWWVLPFYLLSILVSGLYPSILIAKVKTLQALKGHSNLSSNATFRKALVVFQFMISGFMIGATLIIFNQLKFMNEQPLGVDVSETMVLEVPNYSENTLTYANALRTLQSKIENIAGVVQVSASSDLVGSTIGWRGSSVLIHQPQERLMIYKITVDEEHLSYLKTNFLAGRNFFDEGDSLSVILNEQALKLYGFNDAEAAINEQIFFAGVDTLRVIGVIQDYFQESLKETIKPTAFLRIDHELKYLSIRHNRLDHEVFLADIEQGFRSIFPELPFSYHFMSELLEHRHGTEIAFNQLFNAFSAIAVIISFLGLLGLTHFVASKRKKEVGIRKVLGATIGGVIFLIFKDFGKLVITGNMIALPILWYLGADWLDKFSFHIHFPWQMLVTTVVFSVLLAFVFSFTNMLKLGRTNPVEVLKNE
ncbi:MAG: FtsX-like permease family protein [Cytophagales bacterium]|nr:FtsX-like permease family protein [Cytophagales bacterium]